MIHSLSRQRLFIIFSWGTLVWFSIFSVTGCSGSQQSSGASAQRPAENVIYDKTFSRPYEKTFEAALKVLRNRGYVLSLSDKSSGILNAEWYSASPLEEDSVGSSSQKETGPNPLLVFLSIILIFGIIFIIIDAASSGNKSDQSSSERSSHDEKEHNRHHHHDDNDAPANTIGYKYIAGLRFLSINDTTTKMELNCTKIVIQNGTPTYSGPVRSAVTAKIFFEALENELYFVQ